MPLRDLGLKKLWSAVRAGGKGDSGGVAQVEEAATEDRPERSAGPGAPPCSLPLLQVWPSQDSPRGEADGQSFVFPSEDGGGLAHCVIDHLNAQHDSGIDSVQVSPSPGANTAATTMAGQCSVVVQPPPSPPPLEISATSRSPSPSMTGGPPRRPSSTLLHPDHARLLRVNAVPTSSPDQTSMEDVNEFATSGVSSTTVGVASCSSSTTSSMTSVAAAVASIGSRTSDPWLTAHHNERRRSSTMTARYSLLDALDLEYALLRAAARGSVGPYSLSESIHKLTFTQSLAFPALARGLANKRRRSNQPSRSSPLDPSDTGMNAFAKVVTALVLMLVSVLVFGVVYKYVRT